MEIRVTQKALILLPLAGLVMWLYGFLSPQNPIQEAPLPIATTSSPIRHYPPVASLFPVQGTLPANPGFHLSSGAFTDSGTIPAEGTCKGRNVNPPLVISGIPTGTQSLALVLEDADHARLHWDLWNIDPATDVIPENSVPAGSVAGITDFGTTVYKGPCMSEDGPHHYVFHLFALDAQLHLPPGSERRTLEIAMQEHVIAVADLHTTY